MEPSLPLLLDIRRILLFGTWQKIIAHSSRTPQRPQVLAGVQKTVHAMAAKGLRTSRASLGNKKCAQGSLRVYRTWQLECNLD